MKFPSLRFLTNRVLIGMVVFFVLVGLWEFRWKPQYRPLYENGVRLYQSGRYPEALDQFVRAYEIAPNSLDVIMMLGWAHFKVNHFEEARFFFDRALRINANTEEAQLGAAFVALETGRGTLDVDLIREYLGNRGGDPSVRILSAGALVKDGRQFEAAAIYRGLFNDRDYGTAARLAIDEMFGLRGTGDQAPTAFPEKRLPDRLDVRFRIADGVFWRSDGTDWRSLYVTGINFGAAPPGYYPSAQPNDAAEYATWLERAAALNINTIRVYSLLPPAFYRAYAKYVEAGGKLALIQQIWIGDPPNSDLFDAAFVERTRADIRLYVDALNGRGEVPPGRGLRGGVYDRDIAANVAAIIVGRELEPSLVAQTNLLNVGIRNHQGRYVRVADATATEVWVARMLDYLIEYETTTYRRQHPVAFVNWPPLDPLFHPTETPVLQEFRYRLARGERGLELPSGPQDDSDVVSIDESRFTVTPEAAAGLFASYHVYPHWPDFMLNEPGLLEARDSTGPNPFLGYLKQLAARVKHPLVVTEYGVPSALGISHLHPLGWHQGGHNEAEQAALLARLARSVQEARVAGGLAVALHDEWYKSNWLVRRFQTPVDRGTLWLNDLTPDQHYGLIGFRTSKWKLFTGDDAAWRSEPALYTGAGGNAARPGTFDGALSLRSLQAAADEGYVYLRLVVRCLDCVPAERRSDGRPRFDKASYAIGLNTLPQTTGIQTLPFGSVTTAGGANFLLILTDPPAARMLIADNYNPYETVATPGVAGETDLRVRRDLTLAIRPRGLFDEMLVEPNVRRFTREGRLLPAQRTNRSVLRYGIDDETRPEADSIGEWYADVRTNAILVRIPWNKLFVTDPSSLTVFAGLSQGRVQTISTTGIELTAFSLVPSSTPASGFGDWTVAQALPALSGRQVSSAQRFTWSKWEVVKVEPYLKKAYTTLQPLFAEQAVSQPLQASQSRTTSGVR
jgi:tetratricopeptide (TPR) repeat protein